MTCCCVDTCVCISLLSVASLLWGADTATRDLPATYVPGTSFVAGINVQTDPVNPPSGVITVETLPPGWTISQATPQVSKTVYDPVSDSYTYRWLHLASGGVFPFNIIYTVVVPAASQGSKQVVGNIETFSGGSSAIGGDAFIDEQNRVATPTFNPVPGTYANSVDVALNCRTAGAVIRYTTNGSEPTGTSSVFAVPLHLTSTMTVKAKAFKDGMNTSTTATGVYTIQTLPASVAGTITYGGSSVGQVRVGLHANSGLVGPPAYSAVIAGPGAYTIASVLPGSYYAWAFRDAGGDGQFDPVHEPWGTYPGNALTLTPAESRTGVDIVLTDPVVTKGDINFDRTVGISDIILCLRMVLGRDVSVGGSVYSYPYGEPLMSAADVVGDGVVGIQDLIFIIRKGTGEI